MHIAAILQQRTHISCKTLLSATFKCVLLLNGLALVVENQPNPTFYSKDPKIAQAENAKAVVEGRLLYNTFMQQVHEPAYATSIQFVISNYESRPLQIATNESTSSIKFKYDRDYKLVVFPVSDSGHSRFKEALKNAHISTSRVLWGAERRCPLPLEIGEGVYNFLSLLYTILPPLGFIAIFWQLIRFENFASTRFK